MRFASLALFALSAGYGADYTLKATPSTVAYGYYWSQAKPALRIKSGDTVSIQTMLTNTPDRLAALGVKQEDIEPELKAIVSEVTGEKKGPGGHILTGPVYIDGAEPGDTLEVRIQKIDYSIPYAYNSFSPQRGVLTPQDFQRGASKIIPLDTKRGVARFSDKIEIPLHPFFGSMGVAPAEGRANSGPPGDFAGNLDNKDLIAGTKLFIPVFVPGALFEVGDGHAGQGNGEVDITALETSLVGTFQFVVRKDMHLKGPRGETPTHWIAMGLDPNLDEALRKAVRDAIDFLVTEKHLTREEAYQLCSVGVDFNVTQAVDGTKGVHGMIPKSIFK